jgi:hypothetical protein
MTVWTVERHCGFGETNFGILWDSVDPTGMPGWQQPSYSVDRHVPGGNITITQLLGLGPLTQTYRLLFETTTEYSNFLALKHTSGELTVYAAMCELPQTAPDETTGIRAVAEVVVFGQIYKRIQDVLLKEVSGDRIVLDGSCECTALFQLQERPA